MNIPTVNLKEAWYEQADLTATKTVPAADAGGQAKTTSSVWLKKERVPYVKLCAGALAALTTRYFGLSFTVAALVATTSCDIFRLETHPKIDEYKAKPLFRGLQVGSLVVAFATGGQSTEAFALYTLTGLQMASPFVFSRQQPGFVNTWLGLPPAAPAPNPPVGQSQAPLTERLM